MQHANTFKHPMRAGDDVTVVDMRHLSRTKRQLIVDKGAPARCHVHDTQRSNLTAYAVKPAVGLACLEVCSPGVDTILQPSHFSIFYLQIFRALKSCLTKAAVR